MIIIENKQKGSSGFRHTDRDEPLLVVTENYFRVSPAAQNKMSLKADDKVLFGVEEEAILICVLPQMSNRKGFKASFLKNSSGVLTISAKSVSHYITDKGLYYVTDEVVNHKGMDWHEIKPYINDRMP